RVALPAAGCRPARLRAGNGSGAVVETGATARCPDRNFDLDRRTAGGTGDAPAVCRIAVLAGGAAAECRAWPCRSGGTKAGSGIRSDPYAARAGQWHGIG